MKITIFGATGDLGGECLSQAAAAGFELTVLVRDATKLPAAIASKLQIVEGNALNFDDVKAALPPGTEAILFAIGVDKHSPENLCTEVTRHILALMPDLGIDRLIWCGGGSTLVDEDQPGFGEKFVRWFSSTFLALRHFDKDHQYHLLQQHRNINWIGLRPLQMKSGNKTTHYRIGFHRFSGMSKISFADCAHGMISMLDNDQWIGKAPIIQY